MMESSMCIFCYTDFHACVNNNHFFCNVLIVTAFIVMCAVVSIISCKYLNYRREKDKNELMYLVKMHSKHNSKLELIVANKSQNVFKFNFEYITCIEEKGGCVIVHSLDGEKNIDGNTKSLMELIYNQVRKKSDDYVKLDSKVIINTNFICYLKKKEQKLEVFNPNEKKLIFDLTPNDMELLDKRTVNL